MGKDPLTVAAEIIVAMGQVYRQVPATEAITKVDDSGLFNVIGDNITLSVTVRCIYLAAMKDVNQRIVRISEHVAQAHGLSAGSVTAAHQAQKPSLKH